MRCSAFVIAAAGFLGAGVIALPNAHGQSPQRYDDLVAFFTTWREFQQPKRVNGVPDYSPRAMAAQHRELAGHQRRLVALDTTGWPTSAQVDYHIVRAEMNGLDFDHRVLRPWANNPAFYVTVFADQSDQPAREGPHAFGAVELWSYTFPLSASDAASVSAGLRAVPTLLAQARNEPDQQWARSVDTQRWRRSGAEYHTRRARDEARRHRVARPPERR